MRFFAAAFGFGLGLASSALAHAASPSIPIQLTLENCPGVDRAEVERVVTAELGAHLDTNGGNAATSILARCDGQRLVLEVSDPISRKTLRRRFDLGAAGGAGKSRLVGIAASELVLASWAELSLNLAPRVDPEGAPPSAPLASAARERLRAVPAREPIEGEPPSEAAVEVLGPRKRWFQPREPEHRRLRLLGLASMRRFVAREGVLWGGGVRVGQEALVSTSWAADTLFETGSIEDRGGRSFKIDTWTLGGQLLLAAQPGPVTLRAGIGLRAGLVFSEREDAESDLTTAVAPWGWPFLALSVTLTVRPFVLDIAGEGGYVALPVSQSSGATAVFRGAWVSAQVGVGVIP